MPYLRHVAIAAALIVTAGCHRNVRAQPEVSVDPQTERTISQGKIVGRTVGKNAHAWLGLPFAQPPVEALRWHAPRPAEGWTGVREAVSYGPSCVQFSNNLVPEWEQKKGEVVGSEDCLTLNVFAPRFRPDAVPSGDARLPVMFWIHGGGNSIGSAATYGGAAAIAEQFNVIVVTTQYRLGVLGWFAHAALHDESDSAEDRSGNYGTLDLIQSLAWVRDNISAFGGDPQNVTVFGESAGGINIFSLMVAPKAKGLFHKAIIQSGLPFSSSRAQAMNLTDASEPGSRASSAEVVLHALQQEGRAKDRSEAKTQAETLGVEEVRALLQGRSAAQLLAPFQGAPFEMYAVPYVIRDGAVIPDESILALLRSPGRHHAVPTILGSNRDEYKLFMVFDDTFTSRLFGVVPRIRDEAAYEAVAAALSQTWRAIGVDAPIARLRESAPAVYSYRFDWDEARSTMFVDLAKLLGAAHGLEVSMLFQNFDEDRLGLATKKNLPGRRHVGLAMGAYWTQFARTGDPGRGGTDVLPTWKPAEKGFLVFDTKDDGGIRMEQGEVTIETVVQQVLDQPAPGLSDQDRCKRVAGTFELVVPTGLWRPEDFHAYALGRCNAWAFDDLRPPGRR